MITKVVLGVNVILKLGILGAGRIGRIHAKNALANSYAEVVAICDPFVTKNGALTREEDFWNANFDAVIIASPSDLHAKHVQKAIELKKHIFCEKPLTQNLSLHNKLKEQLKNYPKIFHIGFNRRFDEDFSLIAHNVKLGEIGQAYYLRITSRDPGLPSLEYLKSSGGMFFDMSIHDFDMARFIMGEEVSEVYARGAALINPELAQFNDIDTALITLKFTNGAFGVIDNSRQAVYGYDQRVEIFGSLGMLSNQNHRSTYLEQSDTLGTHSEPLLNFFLERYEKSYELELQNFINACLNLPASIASIDDSLKAIKIAYAAKLSLEQNRSVKIEEI